MSYMKKTLFLLPFIAFVMLMAGSVVEYFTAQSQNDNIIIRWKTSDETGVQKFILERSVNQLNEFTKLAEINPKGNNSTYEYIDASAFKQTDNIYAYRLQVVTTTGSFYVGPITVLHKVSSVKRTWGSIKAMFR
ncbi:hypothetical protein [Candidatus Kryptobacter tengchongensis]|uniref:Purple acid Phosphatase, N-terminal domain n=1 Tax=Kryptobacter tengchongensis TaxID=1643429 RepID=A0A656D831_KRYT1|nr:hypothetical protein [Candidatus Kryptobacter tengchongensis]CUT00873.1 hypothetical protein JGI24_00850 [Candidatus Kryptobacter tengchongensis]